MAQKYRPKALNIEAVQWTGENRDEIEALVGDDRELQWTELAVRAGDEQHALYKGVVVIGAYFEDDIVVPQHHWLVRYQDDTFDRFDPATFALEFEPAVEPHVTYVTGDDWRGIYVDGKLLDQGHSFSLGHFMELLGIKYRKIDADAYLEAEGELPETIAELRAGMIALAEEDNCAASVGQ